MKRVSNAIRLDWLSGRSYVALTAGISLVGLLIGSLTQMPIFAVILTVVLGVFGAGGVFAVQEKNHGEKLYGSLPLLRREMVLGRYLYAWLIGLASTVLAGLFGYLASVISGASIGSLGPKRGSLSVDLAGDTVVFWAAIGLAIAYFCFAVAVAFPIYLRFGFSRAYVLTMLPLYLVVLAALLVTRSLNLELNLDSASFFFQNAYLLPIIGLGAGLVLLSISLPIAIAIYADKEI